LDDAQKDAVRILLNLSGLAQVFQTGFGGGVAALGEHNEVPFRAAGEEPAPLIFRAIAQPQRSRSLTLRVRDGMSEGDGAFLNLCIFNAQDDSGKILGDCGSACRDVACYVSTAVCD
jgi:hypothetical protein